MKTPILILISLLSWSLCKAQSNIFPQNNADIWYSYRMEGFVMEKERGYIHSWHSGDTLINGDNWIKFTTEKQSKITITIGPDTDTTILSNIQNLGSQYYFKSNDTVYYWNELINQKAFYWYANPQVGDIWEYYLLNLQDNVSIDTAYVKVESITPENINGTTSNNIKLTSCDKLGNTTGITITEESPYFELFNSSEIINTVMGLRAWKMQFKLIAPNSLIEYPAIYEEDIICYKSDDIAQVSFSNTFPNCYAYIFLDDQEHSLGQFSFYPNPVQSELRITNNNLFSGAVQLFDLQGKSIRNSIVINPQSTTIMPLNDLKPGMYILKCSDENGKIWSFKIIKD